MSQISVGVVLYIICLHLLFDFRKKNPVLEPFIRTMRRCVLGRTRRCIVSLIKGWMNEKFSWYSVTTKVCGNIIFIEDRHQLAHSTCTITKQSTNDDTLAILFLSLYRLFTTAHYTDNILILWSPEESDGLIRFIYSVYNLYLVYFSSEQLVISHMYIDSCTAVQVRYIRQIHHTGELAKFWIHLDFGPIY